MAVVLRTEDEPAASRMDYWRNAVCDSLVPLTMHIDTPGDYQGKLVHSDLGIAQFTEITSAPLLVQRTPKLIRASDPGLYKIEMHTRGSSVLVQGGQETVLRTGDVAIVDTSRPYQMAAGHTSRSRPVRTGAAAPQLLTLMVPHAMLPLSVDQVAAATGLGPSGRTATSGLAAAVLARLGRCAVAGEDATAARLASVVVDLLAVGLADRLGRASAVAPETHRRTLVLRIQAFIEEHLGDVELSPATIAAAHHISLRYLHKLFASQDTTVADLIRTRRLEECRRELTDPTLQDRPVGAVAARWGFRSAAHFNRLFRATYGLPPATYRRLHLM